MGVAPGEGVQTGAEDDGLPVPEATAEASASSAKRLRAATNRRLYRSTGSSGSRAIPSGSPGPTRRSADTSGSVKNRRGSA
ncbi:hypothetical protein GCM10020221_21560 [Streptomyces thioluteus]|uniref:Uncharacterized protein n=1 Tax=Streptomyces thioluteus TaxID=66431 RepID=A0ABN3WTW6_STRTU